MAHLKGKGAMTGVNLIAKVYKNGVTKDSKSQYADVQLDARDPRGPAQTNLHLKSDRIQGENGKVHYNNGAPYSTRQMEEIAKAAGPNTEPILDKSGNEVGTVYGFKSNVMPATRGTGLVVNTKSVEASEFKVDNKTLDNQFASMRAAHEVQAAAKESQAQAAAVDAEQEQAVEVDEPAVG
ncbi:hypothetical protein [Streptomyces albipurpureus]|uniref:Uncharacterized protein n=1 Tax=Streptomyces albipurpureus TaxID=2897419 RepID=A0ABT0UVT7_9ACTN|nr:hypothetical protein [Streptomyces sp. CWNU-1]MCM2392697.1 hypothetical protein [Streptomyces sp. CWNU-1]